MTERSDASWQDAIQGQQRERRTGRSPCGLAGHPGCFRSPREGAHTRFRETQCGRSREGVVGEAPSAGEPGGRSRGSRRDLQVGAAPWFRSSGSARLRRGKPGAAAPSHSRKPWALPSDTCTSPGLRDLDQQGEEDAFHFRTCGFTLSRGWQLGGLHVSYRSFKWTGWEAWSDKQSLSLPLISVCQLWALRFCLPGSLDTCLLLLEMARQQSHTPGFLYTRHLWSSPDCRGWFLCTHFGKTGTRLLVDVSSGHWGKMWKPLWAHCCLVAKLCLTLCNPRTAARPSPLSMGFPRQEYWSELPFPSPGDLPGPEIKSTPPALAGVFFTSELPGKPRPIVHNLIMCIFCACQVLPQINRTLASIKIISLPGPVPEVKSNFSKYLFIALFLF